MSELIPIRLVRCSASEDKRSELIKTAIPSGELQDRLLREAEQVVEANEAKGLHLAADDETEGPVTYIQEVVEGGFFIYVGDPDSLEEHWIGAGQWVAFNDNQGTGHASKVGPDGVKRNFRVLKGHLSS